MGNINNKVKDLHTNTFYVNPTHYEDGQVTKSPDPMGVSFGEPSYKDGIEVPEKFVTVNGATNYHILDAVNLYWDDAKIPWAQKITKWKDAIACTFDPDYEYNKPDDGGSWAKDGIIRESEDVADILNYLIYRTVSIDYTLDQMNSIGLQTPALRLVNNRTDWYTDEGGIRPDDFDGDTAIHFYDTISDNRFTVKSAGLKAYLYPYLVSTTWHAPDSEDAPINISEDIPLYNSDGVQKPGIVLSDTGWDVQREKMWNGKGKIKRGGENFDIFQIETISTSPDIRFESTKKRVLDSFVNKNLEITETDGTVDENTIVTCFGYKLPVVAYKCINTETYPYTPFDLLKTLIRYNNPGKNGSDNSHYREIRHTSFTPEIDPTYTNVTFAIEIGKVPSSAEDEHPALGYKADSKIFNAIVYKGDNTLYELKLDKSQKYKNLNDEFVKQTFTNSRGEDVTVFGYLTYIPFVPNVEDYENENIIHLFKSKIDFQCEFGPEYDKEIDNTGNPDDSLRKSHMYPYFIAKPEGLVQSEVKEVINSIKVDAYKTIYGFGFESSETEDVYVLYDNEIYGKITYEKIVENDETKWEYFYYAPVLSQDVKDYLNTKNYNKYKEQTQAYNDAHPDETEVIKTKEEYLVEHKDDLYELNIKLYALMYYQLDDVKTNRLLNPLYAELPIRLKQITKNKFTTIHGKEITSGNYVDDCVVFEETENYSVIDENGNLVINLCDICETEKGSTDFSCEILGYALEDYTSRVIETENLVKTQLGVSYKYPEGTVFPIKTEDDFVVLEKDTEGNYRKSVPQSQFWSYDGSKTIEIDEINITESDNNLVDIVSGVDSETGNKFVNLVIKNSTALYPKANGLLTTEGEFGTVDADKDYFYIVLKIKCARNFDKFLPKREEVYNIMWDECETYYALKIRRANLRFTEDAPKTNSGYLRENIYLETLLSADDLSVFYKHTGDSIWGINPNDIVEQSGIKVIDSDIDNVDNIILSDVHFFNIGDQWPWRHLFTDIDKSGGDYPNKKLEHTEEIEVGDEVKTINYTTNIGLFTDQLSYLSKEYDQLAYGTSPITPYGDDIIIFRDSSNIELIFSRGPILYIDRLNSIKNGNKVFYETDTTKMNIELCVGNDSKYNYAVKKISEFEISKKNFDIVPISQISPEGQIYDNEYYSFTDDPNHILELNETTVENPNPGEPDIDALQARFCFVSTLLGSYDLGKDENNNQIARRNINEFEEGPIVMSGDILDGQDINAENTLKHLLETQTTKTIKFNANSNFGYDFGYDENGNLHVLFKASYLDPAQDNILRLIFNISSDIYKKTKLDFMFRKKLSVNNQQTLSSTLFSTSNTYNNEEPVNTEQGSDSSSDL